MSSGRLPDVLVGRADDLRDVARLVAGGARWLTLVGLGGVGKSRLGLEAATKAAESLRAALVVCEAVGIQNSDELAIALAGKIERPAAAVLELERDVMAHLRALGPVIVLLDHLEHLVTTLGPFLRRLLAAVPELLLIGTSRLPFELPEEVVLPVLPLDCDGPDSSSATLLRMLAGGPRALPEWVADPDGLARLARRLDGIPLAIELAAARSHLITPRDLEALLDLRFSLEQPTRDRRQSTRDVAIEWAWSRLSPGERAALGRLSVLAGGFDLDLALALIGGPRAEAFALFEQLTRFSLIVPAARSELARHRVLETVRELALSRLDAGERSRAMADMGRALLDRFPPSYDPLGLPGPAISQRAAEVHEHLLAVLHHGRDQRTATAIAHGLEAGALLIARFRRSGCELPLVEMVKELLDLSESDACPTAVLLAAGLPVVLALANRGGSDDVEDLLARLETRARVDALSDARTRVVRAIVCHLRWDYRGVEASVRSLATSPVVSADPVLSAMVAENELIALRALGAVDAETAERRMIAATAGLDAAGLYEEALRCRVNRVFLATHLGRPDIALAIVASPEVARDIPRVQRFAPYIERERARAEVELGLHREALIHFDAALASFAAQGPTSTQTIETVLDRAATAIEAGDYAEARRDLASVHPLTVFARGYRHALVVALGALAGADADAAAGAVGADADTPTKAPWEPTGTVEDEALRLWRLVAEVQQAASGAVPLAPIETLLASDASPLSFRVRQAQRVARAACAIVAASPATLALSSDGSALLVAGLWHDLTTAPLLQQLVSLVTTRALHGEPPLARDALADQLWAGERMTPRSRGKRLTAALSALAERGCALASDGDHVRLPSGSALLVLSRSLWPGLGTQAQRGRGRPRKTTGPAPK